MASCANERMKWRDTNCSSHQPDDAGATRHPPSARNWNRPSTSRQTCKPCKVPQGTFSLLKAATATNGHLKKLSPLILGPLSEKPSMTGALVSQDSYDPPFPSSKELSDKHPNFIYKSAFCKYCTIFSNIACTSALLRPGLGRALLALT